MKNLVFIFALSLGLSAFAEELKGTFKVDGSGDDLSLSVELENSSALQSARVPARFNITSKGEIVDFKFFYTAAYATGPIYLDTNVGALVLRDSELAGVLYNILKNAGTNRVRNSTSLVDGNKLPRIEVLGTNAGCLVEYRSESRRDLSKTTLCAIKL